MELWELRKEPHLSASSIASFIDCGLSYRFSKIDKLPIEFEADSLLFGSAIHLVLAQYFEEKMIGNSLPLKEMQQEFEDQWSDAAEENENIRYSRGKDFQSLMLLGKELLAVWYHKRKDDKFKILGVEQAFSFKIPGLPLPIIGAWDVLEEDNSGTLIITDFKTAGRSYSNDEVDKNMQLTIYQMAARASGYSDRDILLRFDCLLKLKKPQVKEYWSVRSDIDERRMLKKIHEVWKGINSGVFIPNDNSWKCGGCAYKNACDAYLSKEVNAA